MTPIIWHKMPGPAAVKALVLLLLVIGMFLVLMTVVFPAISPLLPYNDMTVSDPGAFTTDTSSDVNEAVPAPENPVEDGADMIPVDPEMMNQSPAMG